MTFEATVTTATLYRPCYNIYYCYVMDMSIVGQGKVWGVGGGVFVYIWFFGYHASKNLLLSALVGVNDLICNVVLTVSCVLFSVRCNCRFSFGKFV